MRRCAEVCEGVRESACERAKECVSEGACVRGRKCVTERVGGGGVHEGVRESVSARSCTRVCESV